MKHKYEIAAERHELIDQINTLLRQMELYFNSVASWNENSRKPSDPAIDPDPDGQFKKIAGDFAETLRSESTHKIPLGQWISEIKRIAIEKFKLTQHGADHTDWTECANIHYLNCTPEEALAEGSQCQICGVRG